MGRKMTYELGQVNIGRRVKVFGHQHRQHGMGGKIVEALPKFARVSLDNHGGKIEQVSWDQINDWTSQNTTALVEPPPVQSAAKAVALTPKVISVSSPAPSAPAAEPEPIDPFKVFATLGERIKQGLADIAAAEDLVDSALEAYQAATREHQQAVARMKELETTVAKAKDAVTAALVGTTAAKPPAAA